MTELPVTPVDPVLPVDPVPVPVNHEETLGFVQDVI